MATKEEMIAEIDSITEQLEQPKIDTATMNHATLSNVLKGLKTELATKASAEAEEPEAPEASAEAEEPEAPEASAEAEEPEAPEASAEAEEPEAPEASAEAEEPEAPEASAEAEELPPHSVAVGKCLTTLAGVKTAGEEITAEMLSGGEKILKSLISKGFITKN